jgi:PAS domain S-box-containing protein
MFENAAVGITRVDLNGVLVDVNQRFCDMLGYERTEVIGKAVATFNHPDEFGQGAALRDQVTRGEIKSQSAKSVSCAKTARSSGRGAACRLRAMTLAIRNT